MATPAKKKKLDNLPKCPYGEGCYRKNPQHLAEFAHSKDQKVDVVDGPSSAPTASTDDSSSLPVCKYGASCYRKNLLHYAEFSHPTAVKGKADDDSGHDTDEVDDEDDKPVKKGGGVKYDDILKRGMSLVKSYSKMSEAERKELIKKAFEAKQKLQEELNETKKEVLKKDKELEKLQNEVTTGMLLMDGEKEALDGDKTVYFPLNAERSYKEGSADQTHFRLAESQFYRLMAGHAQYRISKVEYVVNPKLVDLFKQCRESLKKTRGEEFSLPVLAFHGTKEAYIRPICEQGFKVPGALGHKHRTDTGWYGKGVYFSEYPSYSIGYIQGATKLLLCQVLPGKVFQCTDLIHGASLQKAHDSHTSPCKKELVIFNSYHILPSYIVHYTSASGDFQYENQKTDKTKGSKTKGAKKSADLTGKDLLESVDVSAKYMQALSKNKKSKAMSQHNIQFTGVFSGTQKQMQELAMKHGAKIGTKAVFDLLIATPAEFDMTSNKVSTAALKGVPIVIETYMYDCIIKGKNQPTTNYEFE